MHTREERQINITMNPDELRALADKMEATWPRLKLGHTCFVDYFYYSDDFKICLYLDQDWFHKRAKG